MIPRLKQVKGNDKFHLHMLSLKYLEEMLADRKVIVYLDLNWILNLGS
jgi:hypothetical protein